jgi:small subunit ribosomal protein S16
VGSRKNPIWRVVVADQRSPRDGRVIETVGRYNAQTEPSEITLDEERLRYWIDRGARPTQTVKQLMRAKGIGRPDAAAAAQPAAGAAEAAAPAESTAEAPAEPADAG